MVGMEWAACCAFMNSKTLAGSNRSPVRTRPRLFSRSPAPHGAWHSRAGGAAIRSVLASSVRRSVDPHRDRPAGSSSECIAPSAQTRARPILGIGPCARARQSAVGIPADMVLVTSASCTPTTPRVSESTKSGQLQYAFWRPVTAIRVGGGNPDLEADPNWIGLVITPNHPEYPSAHACFAGGWTEALRSYFGIDAFSFAIDSNVPNLMFPVRSYSSFSEALTDIRNARIYGGMHYENSTLRGAEIGQHVAEQ